MLCFFAATDDQWAFGTLGSLMYHTQTQPVLQEPPPPGGSSTTHAPKEREEPRERGGRRERGGGGRREGRTSPGRQDRQRGDTKNRRARPTMTTKQSPSTNTYWNEKLGWVSSGGVEAGLRVPRSDNPPTPPGVERARGVGSQSSNLTSSLQSPSYPTSACHPII